jgi:nucleobase:cation symporter-1, NCS1 family
MTADPSNLASDAEQSSAGGSTLVAEPVYGDRVVAVEEADIEPIPLAERHGHPRQLLWTWASPNLEFATIFVGVIGVAFFGLSFWQAAVALAAGSALGALTQGILSTWGPSDGVPQMVLSRIGFGYWGNILPSALMSIGAGIGWFAVNSVSGTFALNTLTHWPKGLCLVIIVVVQVAAAFFGHNFVHVFERLAFPFLAVVFALASISILSHSHLSSAGGGGGIAGLLTTFGAAFGYAAGWNPYASDYTRYLKPTVNKGQVAMYAFLGIFLSCAILEIIGAASMTIPKALSDEFAGGSPTGILVATMPTWIAKLTLVAIAVGAVSANVLNIYSGAIASIAMGIKLPFASRRAITAVVFGAIGLVVAFSGLNDAGSKYENFLLVMAYWIAPWLGVVLVDRWMRGKDSFGPVLQDKTYANWAGPIAMLVAMVVSILLFSDQTEFSGFFFRNHQGIGDLTFEVGFVLAAVIYYGLVRVLKPSSKVIDLTTERV